jgi:hypothetical protein
MPPMGIMGGIGLKIFPFVLTKRCLYRIKIKVSHGRPIYNKEGKTDEKNYCTFAGSYVYISVRIMRKVK